MTICLNVYNWLGTWHLKSNYLKRLLQFGTDGGKNKVSSIAWERIWISKIAKFSFLYFEGEIFFTRCQFFVNYKGRPREITFEILNRTTHIAIHFWKVHKISSLLTQVWDLDSKQGRRYRRKNGKRKGADQ